MMAKHKKPTDPAAAMEAKLQRLEREAERKRLVSNGATVTVDRAGHLISAYRSNVFRLLLERGTITPNHHDAAYTLGLSWAAWKGLDGKAEAFGEQIDGSSGCAELVTDRMIRAGRDVERAMCAVPLKARAILTAFMVATVEEDRPMAWRGVMERLGYVSRNGQTEAVVAALEALRIHYQEPEWAAA
jgi:hypothetical protein